MKQCGDCGTAITAERQKQGSMFCEICEARIKNSRLVVHRAWSASQVQDPLNIEHQHIVYTSWVNRH